MAHLPITRRQFLQSTGAIGALTFGASVSQAAVRYRWSAIAIAPSSGSVSWSWGADSQAEAKRMALQQSGVRNRSDRRIAVSGKGYWLAVSTYRGGWGAASGSTLFDAIQAATVLSERSLN